MLVEELNNQISTLKTSIQFCYLVKALQLTYLSSGIISLLVMVEEVILSAKLGHLGIGL